MANEVTKTIWGGLISTTGVVTGISTLRQHAQNELNNANPGAAVANTTDLNRAAAVGISLSVSIPTTGTALNFLTDNVSNTNLVIQLNNFLALYSRIRIYRFLLIRTSWGNGNSAGIPSPYFKTAYLTTGTVTPASDTAPASTYTDIESGDDIDLSNYQNVILALRGIITTNSAKSDTSTINYCHSSCHSVCHTSRGRR